jgi:hypothetical protein
MEVKGVEYRVDIERDLLFEKVVGCIDVERYHNYKESLFKYSDVIFVNNMLTDLRCVGINYTLERILYLGKKVKEFHKHFQGKRYAFVINSENQLAFTRALKEFFIIQGIDIDIRYFSSDKLAYRWLLSQ